MLALDLFATVHWYVNVLMQKRFNSLLAME